MKIFSIFNGRFPSEKAASLFAAKGSEAFAEIGANLFLLVPRRFRSVKEDPFKYYGVKRNFKLVYIPVLDLYRIPIFKKIAFPVSVISFSVFCLIYLIFNAKKGDVIYSNESVPLFVFSFFFKNTFYEMHDFPEKSIGFYKKLFKRISLALIHNKWKAQKVMEIFNFPKEKILYQPNAVDLRDFGIELSKEDARAKLHLPTDIKMVVYTGHLYSWKGADTLAEAAKLLPDVKFFFIGGTKQDVLSFSKNYEDVPNISFVGHRQHSEIPIWQKASDVLVLPNTAKEDISKYYTSPMKLFEYMASGRPIVATDIPSIREILDHTNSFICEPDNPKELASKISLAISDVFKSKDISTKAFLDIQKFTWKARALNIISFINSKLSVK